MMNDQSGLRHIVLCAFKAETPASQREQLVAGFARLRDSIAQVRAFECGVNRSPEGLDDGYTHCFTLGFDGAAARDAYLVHPAHLSFVEQLKPWLGKVLVFDYEPGAMR